MFIAMTYYDGESLKEKIAEGPLQKHIELELQSLYIDQQKKDDFITR